MHADHRSGPALGTKPWGSLPSTELASVPLLGGTAGEALPGASPNTKPKPATWSPLLMHSTLIYANPIPAGVCRGVQEDLAPEQTMRHSLIGVKNLQRVTNSREVRGDRVP